MRLPVFRVRFAFNVKRDPTLREGSDVPRGSFDQRLIYILSGVCMADALEFSGLSNEFVATVTMPRNWPGSQKRDTRFSAD